MKRFLILFAALMLFQSCDQEVQTRRDFLPGYIGRSGEILVVMEQRLWDGACGDSIRSKIHEPYQILNQYEHLYDLQHRTFKDFNKYFKPFRTIILADIKDVQDNQKPRVEIIKEKYAKDQVLIHIHAKSPQIFLDVFEQNKDGIIERIDKAELERVADKVKAVKSVNLANDLAKKYGLSLTVHRDFKAPELRDDFIWLRRQQRRPQGGRNHDVEQGIMIYSYPYEEDSTFTREFLLARRDSVLKANVPGSAEGSYMTTEYFYDPVYEDSQLGDGYAGVLKGLWTVEGGFMGGPFVSLTTFDELNHRIVTASGYVYAPNFDKREYIRELEAILHTIKFHPISK